MSRRVHAVANLGGLEATPPSDGSGAISSQRELLPRHFKCLPLEFAPRVIEDAASPTARSSTPTASTNKALGRIRPRDRPLTRVSACESTATPASLPARRFPPSALPAEPARTRHGLRP